MNVRRALSHAVTHNTVDRRNSIHTDSVSSRSSSISIEHTTSEDHTSEREETINPSDIIDGSEILNQMAGSEPDINEGSSRYSHGERYSSVQKYINALSMSRRLQTFTELVDNYNDKLNLLFSMEQPLNIYTNK